MVNNGTASFNGGSFESTSTGYGAYTEIGAESIFNDMDIETSGGAVSVFGTATWNSGNVTTNSATTNPRHMFYVAADGIEAELTINEGEFTFNPTNLTRKGSYVCAHAINGGTVNVYITGGTFHKPSTRTAPIQEIADATSSANVIITGGTFEFDPSAWVADGYEAVQSGTTWTVSAK